MLYPCKVGNMKGIDLPASFTSIKNLLSGSNTVDNLTVNDVVLIMYVTQTNVSLPSNVSGLELLDSSVYQGDGSNHLSIVIAYYSVTNRNVSFTIPNIVAAYGNTCALFHN